MGVTSMGSRKTVRFGEANVPETEEDLDGVAHNSIDLDETQEHVEQGLHDDAILVLMRLWGVMEAQHC